MIKNKKAVVIAPLIWGAAALITAVAGLIWVTKPASVATSIKIPVVGWIVLAILALILLRRK